MNRFDSKVFLQFISARPDLVLNQLAEAGVILMDVHYKDALTVEMRLYARQRKTAESIIKKNYGEIKKVRGSGTQLLTDHCLKRPIVVVGLVLFFLSACFLPGRILFLTVTGNETISEKRILEEAERAGITFGIRGKEIRSEEIKNRMLMALPEVQWVGINTSGCIATIHVRERTQTEIDTGLSRHVSHIVAQQDGIITDMSVEKGTPLVVPGQSVRTGDILVSGYADYGYKLMAQNAMGEIMAHTMHKNTFITLKPTAKRGALLKKYTCLGLRIGQKVIKFCNHSGIHDAVCVKMYSEDYWKLPGGYRLPVSFIRTSCAYYAMEPLQQDWTSAKMWLPVYAQAYLKSQMVAGQILDSQLSWRYTEDDCRLIGTYACHEMIGEVKYEEIIEDNAEDN